MILQAANDIDAAGAKALPLPVDSSWEGYQFTTLDAVIINGLKNRGPHTMKVLLRSGFREIANERISGTWLTLATPHPLALQINERNAAQPARKRPSLSVVD